MTDYVMVPTKLQNFALTNLINNHTKCTHFQLDAQLFQLTCTKCLCIHSDAQLKMLSRNPAVKVLHMCCASWLLPIRTSDDQMEELYSHSRIALPVGKCKDWLKHWPLHGWQHRPTYLYYSFYYHTKFTNSCHLRNEYNSLDYFRHNHKILKLNIFHQN